MRRYKFLIMFLSALVIGVGGILAVGAKIIAPRLLDVGVPPLSLSAQTIQILRRDAAPIAAWYVEGSPEAGSVLLLHGVRSNRRQMIGRAHFLNNAGYSVLLIDMQGHGETAGTHIMFGYLESRDVRDAVAYIRERNPDRSIGILGVSLGGAAALLGEDPVEVNALVIESVYNNIEKATKNRLKIRLGSVGGYLAPLLLWQIEPRLRIKLNSLSPVAAIARLRIPVFLIAGEDDRRTTLADSRELYENAPEPKMLWVVPGARHENFHKFSPQEYESRVLGFLLQHLRGSATKRITQVEP